MGHDCSLTMRTATKDDAAMILAWRNDPLTVANSNKNVVSEEEHAAWFSKVLHDSQRHLLICESEGEPLAVTRLDFISSGVYEISINVAPLFRGRGLGAPCIDMTCRYGFSLDAKRILAKIHKSNASSLRVFEKSSFSFLHDAGDHVIWKRDA